MESFLVKISIMLVPAMLALTAHEVFHGFVADRLGDNTPRQEGRLTLNPLKHIDFFGTLALLLVHFGWARPTPIDYRNFSNPKRAMMWISLAGPGAHFILAVVSGLALRALYILPVSASGSFFLEPVTLMLSFSLYINVILMVLNLLPIPGVDGGRVAMGLLPYRHALTFSKLEPYGFLILIFVIFFTPLFAFIALPSLEVSVNVLTGPAQGKVVESIKYISKLPSLWDLIK